MKRLLVTLGAVLLLAASGPVDAPLRIAVVDPAGGACAPVPQDAPAGERAYYEHLAGRLQASVQRCPFADEAAAAQAVAEARADLAAVGAEAFGPTAGETRAILTVRRREAPNRIPVVVAVRADASPQGLADLRGASLALDGRSEIVTDLTLDALSDYGAEESFFGGQMRERGYEEAAAALRAGRADALALHAGAWQRLCRGDSLDEDLCGDLRVVWSQRPVARRALIVPLDMPAERRFRLIGIHIALHLEAPEAFAYAVGYAEPMDDAEAFEPTEARALALQGPAVG